MNYDSKLKPRIIKCFEASICHVTKRDSELMEATDHAYNEGDLECTDLIVYIYKEGCFIFAAWEDNEVENVYTTLISQGYSQALIELLKLTRYHDCTYLQLDRDGVEYDDLPKFSW